jgi:DNA-binding phage protein
MTNKTTDLVELIKQSGISVTKIATDTGVPRGRIYNWIVGRGTPKHEDSVVLQEYLLKNKQNDQAAPSGSPVEHWLIKELILRGIRPSFIAKNTDIPQDRIYKWFSGRGTPKYDDSKKLQEILQESDSVVSEPNAEYFSSSDWTLRQIVGIIQAINDWTIEQVAESIQYTRVTLAHAMSVNDEAMKTKLLRVHGDLVKKVPSQKNEPVNVELVASLRDQISLLKELVQDLRDQVARLQNQHDISLNSIEQNQLVLLAYQKAAHNLRVEFAAGSDKRRLTSLRAHADKALAESYVLKSEKGNHAHK